MNRIFGKNLRRARKMAGISLQELSNRMNQKVSKQALNKYELGKMKPDSDLLISMANALNVSVDYFHKESSICVELEKVEFRTQRRKMSKSDDLSVRAIAIDAFERYFELEKILQIKVKADYFEFQSEVSTIEDVEIAANQLRIDWQLGLDPILNVVEMLEDKGYAVVQIEAPDSFEGMKANFGSRRLIVLNNRVNREMADVVETRITALHELAHHTLNFSAEIGVKEREKFCQAFAFAVLFPLEMAKRELFGNRYRIYIREFELIKEKWGVPFAAILERAKRGELLERGMLRKFQMAINERRYDKLNKEPGKFGSKEMPTKTESMVFMGLAKEVLTMNEAAYYSGMNTWKLREQMQLLI